MPVSRSTISRVASAATASISDRAEASASRMRASADSTLRLILSPALRTLASVSPALLAVGGRRIAQRALDERAEDVADAERCGADADRRETGADDLGGSEIHDLNSSWKKGWLVKVDRVVDVQRRQDGEDIGLDRG